MAVASSILVKLDVKKDFLGISGTAFTHFETVVALQLK